MIEKIQQLLAEVENLTAQNAEELEALRIKYLSKKGAINDLMADFRNVAAENKKEVGMKLNELKNRAQEKITALKEIFESQDTGCNDLDLTRTAYPIDLGGGIVLCESETGIVLPAEAGGLTLKKQYKYGRVLLWKYTKPMQNTDPAENEPKGEAL